MIMGDFKMEERRKENILDCAKIIDKHNIMLLKIIKWLIISNIVISILFFASNMVWLYTANQYDYVEYEQDGNGINTINQGMGDVTIGTEACSKK